MFEWMLSTQNLVSALKLGLMSLGSLLLGVPICWTVLLRGMWCKQCIINGPLTNFETSMSGYGMYVKYLMAGFLGIYALTMLIQFISYFLSNASSTCKKKHNVSDYKI